MKVVLIPLIEMMVTTASKQIVVIITKTVQIILVLIIRTITKMFLKDQIFMQREILHIMLLDSDILENIIDLIGKCPTEACTGNVKYYNDFSSKQGLSCKLEFSCRDYASKKVIKASTGKNPFEVNMRAIIALRENGKGYAGLESVCGYMNLVPPMNVNSFNRFMGDIISSYNVKKTV